MDKLIISLISFGFLLFIFISIFFASVFSSRNTLPNIESGVRTSSEFPNNLVTINVMGEILKPGIYNVPKGTLLIDIISKLGGFTPNVDIEAFTKEFDLSEKIEKGLTLVIPGRHIKSAITTETLFGPNIGSNLSSATSQDITNNSSETISVSSTTSSSKISINNATIDQLDILPGIGQTYAQKIVTGRPYVSLNDLLTKKILGKSTFDGISNQIDL